MREKWKRGNPWDGEHEKIDEYLQTYYASVPSKCRVKASYKAYDKQRMVEWIFKITKPTNEKLLWAPPKASGSGDLISRTQPHNLQETEVAAGEEDDDWEERVYASASAAQPDRVTYYFVDNVALGSNM